MTERASATGRAYPLGANRIDGGTNFSVWSRTQAPLDLLLFDGVDDALPSCVVPLDRLRNRTAYYWHVFVPSVERGPGLRLACPRLVDDSPRSVQRRGGGADGVCPDGPDAPGSGSAYVDEERRG